MQNYHIKQHNGHWDLTLEGAGRSAITRPTKAEIIQATQAFMDGKTASVKIHGTDGRFEEERTYPRSADPSKSAG